MEQNNRESWGSRFGFIMAAAGSAVGLGNIWRFPYLTGMNGGGAFILIYLVFTFGIGVSVMITEFALGRRTKLSAVGAYRSHNPNWTFAGILGVLTAFFIMGFYPVVGGWSLAYIFKALSGELLRSASLGDTFSHFITSPIEPLAWMVAYLLINIAVVARGISGGIEKASKVLMPALYILFIIIAIRSLTLPGATAGLAFLFRPDFGAVTGETILAALGQAFFSLSIGMGCMMTYGSYLSKQENLPTNAMFITMMDTSVALLSGIAIFPALFAFHMEPTGGPGLVFVVVPSIFARMGPIGTFLSLIFFVALSVAALTSSVSLMEVVVSYLIDERKLPRTKSVNITALIMVVCAILSSLSLGPLANFHVLGVPFFDFFDILTDKIFLAIGGMILTIFAGWFVNKEDLKDELTNQGSITFPLFEIWYFLVKFIIPIAIAVVAVFGILSVKQPGVLVFGIGLIAVLALFSRKL